MSEPRAVTARRLRLVGAAVVLALIGYLGGVVATTLWPVTIQTQYYEAQVRPSLLPSLASTVHSPTVVGDIDVEFTGPVPAPGLETRIVVRPEITEVFAAGRVDIDRITPGPDELRSAVETGLRQLALTFVLGVVLAQVAVACLFLLGRPRWPWRGFTATLVAGALLAIVVPGTAALLTYRTDNVLTYRTSGLLGSLSDRPDLLTDIDQAAAMGGQYVQNLLALSDALQQEFTPITEGPSGARLLLVADVHGMNFYPLMRQIVVEQDIDAVIDAGDLVNFGRPSEGDVAGIYAGIESLGVPYLFVRGNHDGTFAGDESVLRRLEQVPNVVLLEPTAGEYALADVNGVRISGFNDPNYFAAPAEDRRISQEDAAQAFADSSVGQDPADVVVGHEPWGMDLVASDGVRINGHMHVAALDGNRVQVGSFTGGGLVNHFQVRQIAGVDDPGELVGVPYAFDILTFDQSCSVQQLTRFTYRNLVSGQPEYDEVSVINGRQLAPPQEGRSCG